MKILTLLIAIATALSLTLSTEAADKTEKAAKPMKKTKLRHVVAFKFKDSVTKEQITEVEKAFSALPKKISQIKSYEWGMNNSPENLNKGCTHGFILTFKSEADRDAYLVHPAHKEFGSLVGPRIGEVFVIDFWAQD